jgi:pimeloyl-ACP methyl ester carboxylesterase
LPNVLDYVFPQYCADMATLLAALSSNKVHWIGTSLGGIIGIILIGVPGSLISKLVVNDIGPEVPLSAVARVGMRIANAPSLEEAELYNRRVYATCRNLTDEQWRHFTIHSLREDIERGRYVPLTDPKIALAYQGCGIIG